MTSLTFGRNTASQNSTGSDERLETELFSLNYDLSPLSPLHSPPGKVSPTYESEESEEESNSPSEYGIKNPDKYHKTPGLPTTNATTPITDDIRDVKHAANDVPSPSSPNNTPSMFNIPPKEYVGGWSQDSDAFGASQTSLASQPSSQPSPSVAAASNGLPGDPPSPPLYRNALFAIPGKEGYGSSPGSNSASQTEESAESPAAPVRNVKRGFSARQKNEDNDTPLIEPSGGNTTTTTTTTTITTASESNTDTNVVQPQVFGPIELYVPVADASQMTISDVTKDVAMMTVVNNGRSGKVALRSTQQASAYEVCFFNWNNWRPCLNCKHFAQKQYADSNSSYYPTPGHDGGTSRAGSQNEMRSTADVDDPAYRSRYASVCYRVYGVDNTWSRSNEGVPINDTDSRKRQSRRKRTDMMQNIIDWGTTEFPTHSFRHLQEILDAQKKQPLKKKSRRE